jgi:hypothetical protein
MYLSKKARRAMPWAQGDVHLIGNKIQRRHCGSAPSFNSRGFSNSACYIPSWAEGGGPVDLEARLASLVEKQLLEDDESSRRPRRVRSACQLFKFFFLNNTHTNKIFATLFCS